MDNNLILNRLKEFCGYKNDKSLYEFMGVNAATFSAWRKKNALNIQLIIDLFPQIDLNWLFRGEKSEEVNVASSQPELSCALQTIDKLVTQMAEKDRQIARLIDLVSSEKNSTQVAAVDVSSAVAGE